MDSEVIFQGKISQNGLRRPLLGKTSQNEVREVIFLEKLRENEARRPFSSRKTVKM